MRHLVKLKMILLIIRLAQVALNWAIPDLFLFIVVD